MKRILTAAAGLILVVALVLGWAYRRQALWESQSHNLELFKSYSRGLEAYRPDHGDYPETVDAVSLGGSWRNVQPGNDIWGHSVRYLQSGGHFVLVSKGRDGRADFQDYAQFLVGGRPSATSVWTGTPTRSCQTKAGTRCAASDAAV